MPASEPGSLAEARGTGPAPETGPRPPVFWIPILAGLAHALLMGVAFPPVGFWPAAFLAPLPLVWIALRQPPPPVSPAHPVERRRRRIARALRIPALVTLGILPLHLYENQWVMDVSAFGFFPMAVIMAGFYGTFVWLLALIHRRFPRLPLTLLVPLIWTGLEVFRGEVVVTGYPWILLAHPLIDAPALPAPAAIIGTYGVSFLVALFAGVAADLLWSRPRQVIPAAVGGFGAIAAFAISAALRPPPPPEGAFRIAVVQTNTPQDNKLGWSLEQRVTDFARFLDLTRQAAALSPKPDLIVWPETMFPGAYLDPAWVRAVHDTEVRTGARFEAATYFNDKLLTLQGELGIPMLVGAIGIDNPAYVGPVEKLELKKDAEYNSVFLINHGEVQPGRYDKIALTPFGETMPYVHYWPWLQNQILGIAAHGMAFDLAAGTQARTFRVPSNLPDRPEVVIATPICFESTKPSISRRLLAGQDGNPRVVVTLTNDGWFGGFDTARLDHLQIARWRAVELAVPVVRAANTGISASIDARGRVQKSGVEGGGTGARVDGVLLAETHPGRVITIYARIGDVFGWTTLGLTGGLALIALVKPRPGARPSKNTPAAAT